MCECVIYILSIFLVLNINFVNLFSSYIIFVNLIADRFTHSLSRDVVENIALFLKL